MAASRLRWSYAGQAGIEHGHAQLSERMRQPERNRLDHTVSREICV
jgi:hypothetical protein